MSFFELLGKLASGVEGFELSVLGLTLGIDPFAPALNLPLVGHIGAARSNRTGASLGITAEPR